MGQDLELSISRFFLFYRVEFPQLFLCYLQNLPDFVKKPSWWQHEWQSEGEGTRLNSKEQIRLKVADFLRQYDAPAVSTSYWFPSERVITLTQRNQSVFTIVPIYKRRALPATLRLRFFFFGSPVCPEESLSVSVSLSASISPARRRRLVLVLLAILTRSYAH